MLSVEQRAGSWLGRTARRTGAACERRGLRRLRAPPDPHGGMDLVVSNLALHWTSAPEAALAQAQRVLRRGGLLMFSTLGPDTLRELAQASADARALAGPSLRRHARSGRPAGAQRVRRPGDGHGVPHAHLSTGRGSVPRSPRQRGNVGARWNAGLRTPRWRERFAQRYERLRREGRLPATFEIVYGHAWKPEQGPRVTADGARSIRFDRPTAARPDVDQERTSTSRRPHGR